MKRSLVIQTLRAAAVARHFAGMASGALGRFALGAAREPSVSALALARACTRMPALDQPCAA